MFINMGTTDVDMSEENIKKICSEHTIDIVKYGISTIGDLYGFHKNKFHPIPRKIGSFLVSIIKDNPLIKNTVNDLIRFPKIDPILQEMSNSLSKDTVVQNIYILASNQTKLANNKKEEWYYNNDTIWYAELFILLGRISKFIFLQKTKISSYL